MSMYMYILKSYCNNYGAAKIREANVSTLEDDLLDILPKKSIW